MAKQISNGVNKKVVFKKRVPEPKEMGREEMKAFEKISADSYRRRMIPFVDDVSSRSILFIH